MADPLALLMALERRRDDNMSKIDRYNKYMYEWQISQKTRSFLDNTINSMIDTMKLQPPVSSGVFAMMNLRPPSYFVRAALQPPSYFLQPPPGFATENSQDNRTRDGVEDEAVLAAIGMHGLRKSCGKDCSNDSIRCTCVQSFTPNAGSSLTYTPFHLRDDHVPDCRKSRHPILDLHATSDTSTVTPSATASEATGSTNDAPPCKILKRVSKKANDRLLMESSSSYHTNFMHQAVGVAIQKKGLSTLNCHERKEM